MQKKLKTEGSLLTKFKVLEGNVFYKYVRNISDKPQAKNKNTALMKNFETENLSALSDTDTLNKQNSTSTLKSTFRLKKQATKLRKSSQGAQLTLRKQAFTKNEGFDAHKNLQQLIAMQVLGNGTSRDEVSHANLVKRKGKKKRKNRTEAKMIVKEK